MLRGLLILVFLGSVLVTAISVLAKGCESISFDSQGGGRAALVECYADSSGALPGAPTAIVALLALALLGVFAFASLGKESSNKNEEASDAVRSGVLRNLAQRMAHAADAKHLQELIKRADNVFGENASHAFLANGASKLVVHGHGSVSVFQGTEHRRLKPSERDAFGRSAGAVSVIRIDQEEFRGPSPEDLAMFFIRALDIRESVNLGDGSGPAEAPPNRSRASVVDSETSRELPEPEPDVGNAASATEAVSGQPLHPVPEETFVTRLNVLARLLSEGLITEQEFATRRAEILSEI